MKFLSGRGPGQRKNYVGTRGLTMVEILLATLILLPLFTLGMQTFIKCIELSDMAKNSSLAVAAVKNRVTAIENTAYDQIFGTYNNTTFTANGLTGTGKTYIDNSNPDHLVVDISFSWRELNGRVIGEDKNLNGLLDAGEDLNANGQLDSIVKVTTQIYEK